jgi:hypothetical protein
MPLRSRFHAAVMGNRLAASMQSIGHIDDIVFSGLTETYKRLTQCNPLSLWVLDLNRLLGYLSTQYVPHYFRPQSQYFMPTLAIDHIFIAIRDIKDVLPRHHRQQEPTSNMQGGKHSVFWFFSVFGHQTVLEPSCTYVTSNFEPLQIAVTALQVKHQLHQHLCNVQASA